MKQQGSYSQFCPVAMAAEIFCTRWTALILRELMCGTTRFNDLRRGVPKMSPALLSKRLKELKKEGVITATSPKPGKPAEYHLSPAGEELREVVMAMGKWGHRWVESKVTLRNLDPSLLMWDMRRSLRPEPLPSRRCTIQFHYPEISASQRDWWLVVDDGKVDLCNADPGFELDLLVNGSLRVMTSIWMGITTVAQERERRQLTLEGDPAIAAAMQQWLGLSSFASEQRKVA